MGAALWGLRAEVKLLWLLALPGSQLVGLVLVAVLAAGSETENEKGQQTWAWAHSAALNL